MATRGGRRPGAGRKKGSINKRSQEVLAKAASEGITPLEYLLQVMRSSNDEAKRLDAAKAAAPYMHPRLNAIEHSGGDKPLEIMHSLMSALDGRSRGIPSGA